jgi:hypothetical protein
LYEVLGFRIDGEVPPIYSYAGSSTGWRRVPKERYQRKRFRDDPELLWDESWTEKNAAERNGLYRIWDCGKIRYVKEVSR